MTNPNADASKSEDLQVEERIVEIQAEIEGFKLELERCAAEEKDFRSREDMEKHIAFAKEIFTLQQDQLRIRVEIDILEKKIRRLRLGYLEDAAPVQDSSAKGFVF